MICQSCSKLNIKNVIKNCIKCTGEIYNNLSVLCDSCSKTSKQCSICLKQIGIRGESRNCKCGSK